MTYHAIADNAVSLCVVTMAVIACITDLRSRRIPNVLTFGGALLGVAFHLATSGWSGGMASIGGWVVGILLFLPFFALRGMGAGDVKLLAALGAWLGPMQVVWLALFTSIAGGVIAIAVAASRGYLRQLFRNFSDMLLFWYVAGPKPVPEQTLETSASPRLAYAIPIFVGTVITLWQY